MNRGTQLILVDGDFRRRAVITHCLSGSAIHVEPFEDTAELMRHWQAAGILLVHDEAGAIASLLEFMGATGNWLPVIAFGAAPDTRQVARAILAGAIDYIAWPFDAAAILTVLDETSARAGVLSNARLREAVARSRINRLTRREREVLDGVASGMSNRMIGEKLAISPRTVEIHRANMLNKMGANHTSEAIRIAIEAALPA